MVVVKVLFHGWKRGAIGYLYDLPRSFVGSGDTKEEAINAARFTAYRDGFEHLSVVRVVLVSPGREG